MSEVLTTAESRREFQIQEIIKALEKRHSDLGYDLLFSVDADVGETMYLFKRGILLNDSMLFGIHSKKGLLSVAKDDFFEEFERDGYQEMLDTDPEMETVIDRDSSLLDNWMKSYRDTVQAIENEHKALSEALTVVTNE